MSQWSDIRDAIHGAIVAASGLAADRVRWSFQDINQEALPYLELHLSNPRRIGQDGVVSDFDAGRAAGKEIRHRLVGLRAVQLQVECYTAATVAGSASVDAEELLEKTRSGFALSSVMDALAAVDVSSFDLDATMQVLPTLVSEKFRGRAVVEIGLYMPGPALEEFSTYIESVKGTTNISGAGVTTNRAWSLP